MSQPLTFSCDRNITEILLYGSPRFTNIQNCIILKFAINCIMGSKKFTGPLFWCRTIGFY